MKIIDFFKNLLDSLISGSFERTKIVTSMNHAFKEYYYSGELEYFCKVSISQGEQNFAHEMSTFFFRSGFKITVENDTTLKSSELRNIAQYILTNKPFVRQLMSLGFDTLIVKGKSIEVEARYALKQYTELNSFMLSSGE